MHGWQVNKSHSCLFLKCTHRMLNKFCQLQIYLNCASVVFVDYFIMIWWLVLLFFILLGGNLSFSGWYSLPRFHNDPDPPSHLIRIHIPWVIILVSPKDCTALLIFRSLCSLSDDHHDWSPWILQNITLAVGKSISFDLVLYVYFSPTTKYSSTANNIC